MNFKNIALIALLLPVASYGKSTEARIAELKEARFQKRLEINKIEEMIDECKNFFRNVGNEYNKTLERAVTVKNGQIILDGGDPLSEEEIKHLRDTLDGSVDDFEECLVEAFEKQESPKLNIIAELFDEKNPYEYEMFNSLKFIQSKLFTQKALMKNLLEKYEHCLIEILQLDIEINKLEHRN